MYKLAWKFSKEGTYFCEKCTGFLQIVDVTYNPKHFFNPGQLFTCKCGTSRLWANSVRFPRELVDWCDGKEVPYSKDPEAWGFCNDQFCPYCWGRWQCLKNGYMIQGKYYDKYGCDSCKQNQFAIGSILGGWRELEGQVELAKWYKDNQGLWRSKLDLTKNENGE